MLTELVKNAAGDGRHKKAPDASQRIRGVVLIIRQTMVRLKVLLTLLCQM